ncbi:hypothetical protein CPB86DRAFT_815898 [Serendipita vermifera]|nr:hypothetical protein CPB86DRAFT_815898 [Serendipita vermifera]
MASLRKVGDRGTKEDRADDFQVPLPTEILREIVEWAAQRDPATAARLEQTCFSFREWVGPILYDTVLLHSSSALINFAFMLTSAPVTRDDHLSRIERTRDFYAKHVRYLSVKKASVPTHIIEDIPRICTNIVTYETTLNLDVLKNQAVWPNLRQLIYYRSDRIPYAEDRWESLTHLWLCTFFWDPFHLVTPPNLRYIAIPMHINDMEASLQSLVKDIFLRRGLTRLKLVVLDIFPPTSFLTAREVEETVPSASTLWATRLNGLRDPRVVVRTHDEGSRHKDFMEEARRTGVSMWARAVRDGMRHPAYKDDPPIIVEDP